MLQQSAVASNLVKGIPATALYDTVAVNHTRLSRNLTELNKIKLVLYLLGGASAMFQVLITADIRPDM